MSDFLSLRQRIEAVNANLEVQITQLELVTLGFVIFYYLTVSLVPLV